MSPIRPLFLVVPVLLAGAGFLSPHLQGLLRAHPVLTSLTGLLVLAAGIAMARRFSVQPTAPGPDELADGFIRFDAAGPTPPRYLWERMAQALTPWSRNYSVTITPRDTMPLSDVIRFYKQFTDRPVYLHQDIANLGIGSICVSARTRSGLVRSWERHLHQHGVICTPNHNRTAVVVMRSSEHDPARTTHHTRQLRRTTPASSHDIQDRQPHTWPPFAPCPPNPVAPALPE